MDVLIPIETSSRELLYKVYLCQLLANNGFKCYLGSKYFINHLVNNLKGYIYLDKGYHKGQSELLYSKIKKNNGIIINLDEEGGVDFADGSTLQGRYSKSLFDFVDLTFLWGKAQHKLVAKNLNKKSKVEVVGHPRFELLNNKYHYLYQREIDQIKKKIHDFILINTNMSFGNNIRGDVFVAKNYGTRFKCIDQIIAFDKKKLEAYRSLILKLSKQVKGTIIIRPHPEENHSYYLNAFNNIENVRVIYKGSVIPWLLSTNDMIHPDCTTAIEYLFSGKVSLSYLPFGYPKDFVTELPLAASKCFTNEDELISFIIEKEDSDKFSADNYPFAEDYFSISKSTTKLIIDGFCSIRDSTPNIRSNKSSLTSLLFLKYYGVLRKLISKNESYRLSENKLEGFNKKNIQQIHNTIISHNEPMNNVNCKPINSHLYVFNRKKK
jgi:surface carbohydrate biosynthesis protein